MLSYWWSSRMAILEPRTAPERLPAPPKQRRGDARRDPGRRRARLRGRGASRWRGEEIASDVGMGRAAIPHHFSDKHEPVRGDAGSGARGRHACASPGGKSGKADPGRDERLDRLRGAAPDGGAPDPARGRQRSARSRLADGARGRHAGGVAPPADRRGRGVRRARAADGPPPLHQPDGRDHRVPLRRHAFAHARRTLRSGVPAEIERHKREMLLVARRMLGIEAPARPR